MGSSSDGKSQSIYSPRKEGQILALTSAYRHSGIDPATVDMIEAHGTGTRVGDQVEFQALRQVFVQNENCTRQCALGSVKSNIGHTKAAAGAAGLIKASLALYHKVQPATLKADEPDPGLQMDDSPFFLCTRTRPWFSGRPHPRRCGVSAFGFGGSNFHVVLEEHDAKKQLAAWDSTVEIFAFSADEVSTLRSAVAEWQRFLQDGATQQEITARAARDRKQFSPDREYRLLAVWDRSTDGGGGTDLFSAALEAMDGAGESPSANIFLGRSAKPGLLAFVFPGQGSQYPWMARDFACLFPEAFTAFETADRHFTDHGNPAELLTDYVFPMDGSDTADRLKDTRIAQPAIGAASLAMFDVLQRFKVVPDATAGHSYGELTALCTAGWIGVDDFYSLSVQRGRLMAEAPRTAGDDTGAMLAVKAPMDAIESLLSDLDNGLVLANRNAPQQGVLSGAASAIREAEAECRKRGLTCRKLPVSAAFHSRFMDGACQPFAEAVRKTPVHPGNIRVFSNVSGAPYAADETPSPRFVGTPVDIPGQLHRGN